MRPRVALACLTLLAACHGRSLPPARVPVASSVAVPPSRGPDAPAFAWITDGSSDRCRVLAPAPGEPRRWLVGGQPWEADGGGGTGAARAFRAEIREVLQGPDGWHFFSQDRRWRADTFTGVPVEVATAPPGMRVGLGTGRPVFVRDGVVDGLPFESPVLSIAFADAEHGYAVVEPGTLAETSDGGTHWSPVPLPADVPVEVRVTRDVAWVTGRQSTWALRRGQPPERLADAHPRLAECEEETRPPRPAVAAPTSAFAWLDEENSEVLLGGPSDWTGAYDLRTGASRPETSPQPDLRCEPLPEAPSLVACRDTRRGDHSYTRIWQRTPERTWTERLLVRHWNRCVATPDGRNVACAGTCGESPRGETSAVCEHRRGSRPRERRVGTRFHRFSPIGWIGDELLQVDDRQHLDHAEFVLGEGAPRRLCPGGGVDGLLATDAGFWSLTLGHDGRLRRSTERTDRSVALVEIDPGVACRVRPAAPGDVPPGDGARWCGPDGVAMAGGAEGIPWISRSADEAWSPAVTDAAVVEAMRREGHRFDCDAIGWRQPAHGVRVVGWGTPRRIEPTWVDEVRPPPVDDREPSRPTRGSALARWRCTRGPVLPHPPGPPGARSTEAYDERYAVGARGRHFLSTDHDWWWAGARRWLPFQFDPRDRMVPLRVDVASALVLGGPLVAVGPTDHVDLVRLTAEAPPTVLVSADFNEWLGAAVVARDGPRTTLWLPAGETFDPGGDSPPRGRPTGPALGLVLRVGDTAPEVARTVIERGADGRVGIFSRGDAWGVVRWRSDGTVVGAAPGSLPAVIATAVQVAPCGPRASGALELFDEVMIDDDTTPVAVHLAFDGGRTCLRGLSYHGLAVRPVGGALVGIETLPPFDERRGLRCRQAGGRPRP